MNSSKEERKAELLEQAKRVEDNTERLWKDRLSVVSKIRADLIQAFDLPELPETISSPFSGML